MKTEAESGCFEVSKGKGRKQRARAIDGRLEEEEEGDSRKKKKVKRK